MCGMICTNAVEFLEIFIRHITWNNKTTNIFQSFEIQKYIESYKYTYTIHTTICIKKLLKQ